MRDRYLVQEVRAVLELLELLLGHVIAPQRRALDPQDGVPLEGRDLVADDFPPVPGYVGSVQYRHVPSPVQIAHRIVEGLSHDSDPLLVVAAVPRVEEVSCL